MDLNSVEKFFANQTSPSQTRRVLEWFETQNGKNYLKKRIDKDYDLLNNHNLHSQVPELDSEMLYKSIQNQIQKQSCVLSFKRTDWLGYAVKAVAAVLVIFTASVFTVTHQQYVEEQVVEPEPVVFQTEDEQHREITLGDGTVVRMNSNSQISVSPEFMQGTREVTLSGEAYFDVEHDTEQPFIIHANQSSVEVLGTAFNVRSLSGEDNVQVAVMDGSVSFNDVSQEKTQQHSIILSKGQYGFMDINEKSISVDDLAVENYLAWKSGRFVFEELTLQQVCTQLNRIYNVKCSFKEEGIRDLHLTANFSKESLGKTLSVIALSLNIGFEKDGDQVMWRKLS